MLSRRIIPCLDVRDGRVVKGVRFRDHVDMGDIAELAQRYRDQGADELVFYDIGASPEARSVDVAWIERIARLLIPAVALVDDRQIDEGTRKIRILQDKLFEPKLGLDYIAAV